MVRMPSSPTESRPYHHGDLRSALLATAERTLRDKGATALSLRELAREIGVSHAAPGRHFKDKQSLLDALALTGFDRMAETLEAADAPDLPLEPRLTTLARAYLGFALDNAALLELMYARKHAPTTPDVADRMAAAIDRTVGSLERLIADGQRRGEIVEGEPARLTLFLGSTLHGYASFAANEMLTPEEVLAGVADLVHHTLHGLIRH
ncbi:TetR/AcrR family transcriptional regulator [Streptomyces sp. DSM 15324]|uniref:TetR/AcrR family transcriptional regulator n=1 Tax=Streptomyces sp. DSM 15324 TaxID=1739111 RepID=UPI00074B0717|nr:TetR/AcrR family transcriptional regulator [Streptomyces sp. DSM 15324]KUO10588.1 TetR family transcriptional regulator [Streptomyces sp. DSM 15324]